MNREEYYKYKHLIDFYLETNHEVSDNSKYSFHLKNSEVKFIRWDYENIPKPTTKNLDDMKDNSKYRKHKSDNIVLHRLDFTLSIKFMKKEYKKNFLIYSKYEDLPYIWFVTSSDNNFKYIVKDSALFLDSDMKLEKYTTYYLNCTLIPKKDIKMNTEHILKFDRKYFEGISDSESE